MTNLQKIREKRDISKYRLSQLSGLSQTYIVRIENGSTSIENVTLKNIRLLAKALNVDYTELLD